MGLLDLLDSIFDEALYNSAVSQRRVLTDEKVKAHNSGNKKLESNIEEKRKATQAVINQIEKERKNK